MKTENSIRNSMWAMISNIVAILIGLIVQHIFLKILSVEYLGINGLFSNIISMLGIVELGIGSAIIYNLYKPIVENNTNLIKKLLNFYKKSYYIIGMIVFIFGIILIPFLHLLVGEISLDINIKFIYFLFLIDIVFSYFLSYKRSILQADQRNYIINMVHIAYLISMNSMQLLVLYITKNYYLYLIVKIMFRILENVIISIIADKKYPYLRQKDKEKLEGPIKLDIITKVRALFFHKIGTFIISGTDNIIISKFLGVITVGMYSNYYLIINSVTTLFSQILYGVSASVGHLLTENNSEKSYNIFNKLRFINFWIASFSSICICVIIQPFIDIWIGNKYWLTYETVIVLSIKAFLDLMSNCFYIYKETAGIFKEDKYVPIIQSVLNIVVSILLVRILGIVGVFLGTIISSLAYWLYSFPKFIYKGIFKRNYVQYLKDNGTYLILFLIILFISILISKLFMISNIYLNFFINIIIGIFIPNISIFVIFRKKENFKYVYHIVLSILKKGEKNED